MKLSFFFSVAAVLCVSAATKTYSQTAKISLELRDVVVEDALEAIKQQCEFSFWYRTEEIDLNRKISINVKDQTINAVLDKVLTGQNLLYNIDNQYVIIYKSPVQPLQPLHVRAPASVPVTSVLIPAVPVSAAPITDEKKITVQQGIAITGTITDENGSPLPGVSISIKGTTRGVVTDFNGKYSITVPDKESVLIFSFLGYITQENMVGERIIMDVELYESVSEIEEVVVIGYGTQNKLTVTGAVSSMSTDDLLRSPVPNVGNMLVGQVTGLSSIQTTGFPGADDPELFVRGIGTLNATSSRPLMLVDGVERSFFQLDPNEIESISILKDASSTAVFGVQGANGVIIVTTKRGTEGAPKINVSLSTGTQVPLRLLDFANSYQYCVAKNEMLGYNYYTDEVMEKFKTQENPLLYPSNNWIKYMVKPFSWQTQNNINISGGSSIIKYFVSLGYFSQDGMLKKFSSDFHDNFKYNRYNYRTNFDINPTSSTRISISIGGMNATRIQPRHSDGIDSFFGSIYETLPMSGIGIVDGSPVSGNSRYYTGESGGGGSPFSSWYGNGTTYVSPNQMNFDISLKQGLDMILKGLSASTKYSYNSRYTHTKNRTYSVPTYTPWEIGMTPNWQDIDPDADPNEIVLVTSGSESIWGYSESFSGRSRDFYWEGALNYNRSFGNHQVSGLFLGNMKKEFYRTSNNNYPNVPYGKMGFVGRATYNYSEKYLFELNAGYNGSENFAKGRRFGFFPAVSAGWILSEENFMKSISFISFLKIRASVGKVGADNVGTDRFLYFPDGWNPNSGSYIFGNSRDYVTMNGARELKLGNPDVTWETAIKQNYAIDMSFFKSRLSVNLDRFFEKRKDILWDRGTIPAFVSVDVPRSNLGKVDNQGYEIAIKWRDQLGKNRQNSYWVGGNISYSRNVIVYMDEVRRDYEWNNRTGHRVGQEFGLVVERLYHPEDFPLELITDVVLAPGDVKYRDMNGDNMINASDETAIGYSRYPDYIFSFNAGFSFKGFDFSMLWQGATHVTKNLTARYRAPFGQLGNRSLLLYHYDNRYVSETLTPNATLPRLDQDMRSWNYQSVPTNSLWVSDASYLRLKNVEIGYRIPSAFSKRLGIQNLRIALTGSNLLTFDNLLFIDPEESGNNSEYPNIAVINLGISFTF